MQNTEQLSKKQILLLCILYFGIYLFGFQMVLLPVLSHVLDRRGLLMVTWLAFAFVVFFVILICGKWLKRQWERFRKDPVNSTAYGLIGMIATYLVSIAATMLLLPLGLGQAENQANNEAFMHVSFPLFFVSAVLFAPFVEEILFRGCVFEKLRQKHGFLCSALSAGILFGLMHLLASFGAGSWQNIAYILVYGSCGFLLCWPFEKSGTIFSSMLAHALFNLCGILLMLV